MRKSLSAVAHAVLMAFSITVLHIASVWAQTRNTQVPLTKVSGTIVSLAADSFSLQPADTKTLVHVVISAATMILQNGNPAARAAIQVGISVQVMGDYSTIPFSSEKRFSAASVTILSVPQSGSAQVQQPSPGYRVPQAGNAYRTTNSSTFRTLSPVQQNTGPPNNSAAQNYHVSRVNAGALSIQAPNVGHTPPPGTTGRCPAFLTTPDPAKVTPASAASGAELQIQGCGFGSAPGTVQLSAVCPQGMLCTTEQNSSSSAQRPNSYRPPGHVLPPRVQLHVQNGAWLNQQVTVMLPLLTSPGAYTLSVIRPEGISGSIPLTVVAPPPAQPSLYGWVDLHAHPMGHLGFGGLLIYGGLDSGSIMPHENSNGRCVHMQTAQGEQDALGNVNDNATHGGVDLAGGNPCGDSIRSAVIGLIEGNTPNAASDEQSGGAPGYPNFSAWPAWNDISHQKMWVEWIRRAYQGGLRVMVALAVNNRTLALTVRGLSNTKDADLPPTDDAGSADLQIGEIKKFVARHSDFMEVAYSSADVQRIVSGNRLAVVIGTEIDHIGDFQVASQPGVPTLNTPNPSAVTSEIDRLYGEGVRYIFPIHLEDNAFGGSAAYNDLFDIATMFDSGAPMKLMCAPANENITYTYNGNDPELQIVQTLASGRTISYPSCPSGQRNSLGLTPDGVVAILEMMRLGMLIDIDHMSESAADQALALAVQNSYPVNSGHNGLRGFAPNSSSERQLRPDQYATIGKLHGMAGVGSAQLNSQQWLNLYQAVMRTMGGGSVIGGFGTDMNGLELAMPPRVTSGIPPTVLSDVQYTNAFPMSSDGTQSWNYNFAGVAHYGMLWDFLQDVRSLPGGSDAIDNRQHGFMYGADYFYNTWRIAEIQSKTMSQ